VSIKQRADTGEHFISAPKVRSSRQRYEKTPLVSRRQGFFSYLADFFRRDGRPFAASALADRIDRGLRVARRVTKLQVACGPDSTLFIGISDQLRQHYIEAYTRADNALDLIDDNLKQEEAWLNEARPQEIINELQSKLEDRRVHLHTELSPLAETLVGASVSLERFRARHNLNEEESWGKPLDLAMFGQIGILLLLEFVANSVFQADTQATGLIGGVLIALLTSLATIILGVMFGIAFQRFRKRGSDGRGIGVGLAALTFVLTFVFVSSLSLIRIAGEGGDAHPLETARLQLMADPLSGIRAMLDLPAFAYTLCICALIAAVARKYLQYLGSFPGLRKWVMKFEEAETDFDDQYADELDDLKEIAQEHSERLEKAPYFIVHCKVPIQTLVADHENVVDQHANDVADVRGAGRLFSAFLTEHGDHDKPVKLPVPDDEAVAESNLTKLAARHRTFSLQADSLCSREDVSEESVASARENLISLVEKKLDDFSSERDEILDAAAKAYQKERVWLRDVASATARQEA
jgi:hypothetical protein